MHTIAFKAMGSPCEIQLAAPSQDAARGAAAAAMADIGRLEKRYSRYLPDSLLSQINRLAAAGGSMRVDAETAALFDYADACHRQSGGLFDVTSGILRHAWDLRGTELPAQARIEPLLARVGWHRVRWNKPWIAFETGMEIDFGGIVKEYAADRAAAICHDAGVHCGVVNLGGDIRILGPRTDGGPWRIGIRDPRRPGATAGTIALERGAVTTSGDYERCIVIDGVRYGHILDPRTGHPVRTLASCTTVAPLCVVAGSAATIALLMQEDGPAWLAQSGLGHFWIAVDGRSGGNLRID
ncbi:MAG: FAD:protein FMN transferase [Gammaproteobacteria bacterium]